MQYREIWLLRSNFIFFSPANLKEHPAQIPVVKFSMKEALSICFPFVALHFIGYLCPWMMKRAIPHPKLPSLDSSLYIATITSFIHLSLQWMNLFSCESIMLSLRVQAALPLLQDVPVPSRAAVLPPHTQLLRIIPLPPWLSQGTRWGSPEHLPSLHFSPGASLNVDFCKNQPDSVVNISGKSPGDLVPKFQLCAGRLTHGEWEGAGAAP